MRQVLCAIALTIPVVVLTEAPAPGVIARQAARVKASGIVRAARETADGWPARRTIATPALNPTRFSSSPTFTVVDTVRLSRAIGNRKAATGSYTPTNGRCGPTNGKASRSRSSTRTITVGSSERHVCPRFSARRSEHRERKIVFQEHRVACFSARRM